MYTAMVKDKKQISRKRVWITQSYIFK